MAFMGWENLSAAGNAPTANRPDDLRAGKMRLRPTQSWAVRMRATITSTARMRTSAPPIGAPWG